MRTIPLLLAVAVAACSGGSSGSSGTTGPAGSSVGSNSTTAAGAGTTTSSAGSTGGSTGAVTNSSGASANSSSGGGVGSTTGSGGPANTIGTPCTGPSDNSCPVSAPSCVEGRIDGGFFCSVACSGAGLNCGAVGGLDDANAVYCDVTGYCVIQCGRLGGYDAGTCPPGEVCDDFACQPGTMGTVPFGTLGTFCTGPDDTSCPPSAPDCVEGDVDGGFFCSLPCSGEDALPCAIAGGVQGEGTPFCVGDGYCAVLCGNYGSLGNFGTCVLGQFCTAGECLKAPDSIGTPCTGPSDQSCPEWSTDCVETGTNTGDFICTYLCDADADCLTIGAISGTPYCDESEECAIGCGGDAGVCPSGLACVTGTCE